MSLTHIGFALIRMSVFFPIFHPGNGAVGQEVPRHQNIFLALLLHDQVTDQWNQRSKEDSIESGLVHVKSI